MSAGIDWWRTGYAHDFARDVAGIEKSLVRIASSLERIVAALEFGNKHLVHLFPLPVDEVGDVPPPPEGVWDADR